MSKKGWIILLVLVGVALAIVLGAVASSQSRAETQYCNALDGLQGSLSALTSLDPQSASKDQVQSDVDAVQSAWSSVKSTGASVHDDNQSNLDNAWNSFQK